MPLANSEIAAVSRRARDRWLQQDSSAVTANGARSRSQSPTNETIYAGGGGTIRSGGSRPAPRPPQRNAPRGALDHGCRCNNCNEWIMGRRYQCANCPSEPESFNLVSHPNPDPFQAHVTVFHMRDTVLQSPRSSTCILQTRPTGRYTPHVDSTIPPDSIQESSRRRCARGRARPP